MNQMSNWSGKMFWIIYLVLLAVLLPHTAWAFNLFEPQTDGWLGVSWGVFTA